MLLSQYQNKTSVFYYLAPVASHPKQQVAKRREADLYRLIYKREHRNIPHRVVQTVFKICNTVLHKVIYSFIELKGTGLDLADVWCLYTLHFVMMTS